MKTPKKHYSAPRWELLRGVNPRGPDRNALYEATVKKDVLLECDNLLYHAKKGERVYVKESIKSYSIYSTLIRRKIARVNGDKFYELFNPSKTR